jgi:NADPH-dependent 2,4-dienoyl-CoA reductase/sulfur reductase-like enzyme/rhodanese-related sulfurtransferase
MKTAKKIVIIGGVACGMKTASRLRRRDPNADITVIEKGEYLSYAACGLPFLLSGMVQDTNKLMDTPVGVVRDALFFKNAKGVTALTRTEARVIDRQRKVVETVDLATGAAAEIAYDSLVIATGATPFVPPVDGADLNGIFTLTTIHDGLAVKKYIAERAVKNAVIIGGGLIGLETAEALCRLGCTVTIIEKLDRLLPGLLDADMALLLARYLGAQGITIRTASTVECFESDKQGALCMVTAGGQKLPAELAVIAAGVRPNAGLARAAGLELGATGAIQVDNHLRTSDPAVYAGGDCVENINCLTGRGVFAPMGSTANKHGRIIADNIAGDDVQWPGVLGTAICRLFDYTVARTGLSEHEATSLGYSVETAIVPGPDKPHFYLGAQPVLIKLIADKATGKLIGAQMLGPGDVAKRIEIAATCLSFGATAAQAARLDLAYAPPFSPAMDNIITAANVICNKLDGRALGISPLAVKQMLDRGDAIVFLDVRSPQEYSEMRIDHPAVRLLPLGKLRAEAETLPKDRPIIITCKTSLRAYEAQLILQAKGFTDVKFMDGGLMAWPFAIAR